MIATLARRALRAGVRRGLVGGSRAWTAVGGAAAFVLALRWLLREEPETVFRQALAPGEGLTVRVRAADGDGEAGVGGH